MTDKNESNQSGGSMDGEYLFHEMSDQCWCNPEVEVVPAK